MKTLRGKLWFVKFGIKLKKSMANKGDGKKAKPAGFDVKMEDMMQMLGGFSVLRLTSLIGMMNVTFTKEELLAMNKKLNRIKKPKNMQ